MMELMKANHQNLLTQINNMNTHILPKIQCLEETMSSHETRIKLQEEKLVKLEKMLGESKDKPKNDNKNTNRAFFHMWRQDEEGMPDTSDAVLEQLPGFKELVEETYWCNWTNCAVFLL